MWAMQLKTPRTPLVPVELAEPQPGAGEVRVAVAACGVCRTDLHVVDGDLPHPKLPIVPGHEIVGRVDAVGPGVTGLETGMRVGIPWLGHTCGSCPYCLQGSENLCDRPLFTGYTRDGGYATARVADARYVLRAAGGRQRRRDRAAAVRRADRLALAAHGGRGAARRALRLRRGRAHHRAGRALAGPRGLCLHPAGRSRRRSSSPAASAPAGPAARTTMPPEPLDCAIIFAPVGALVPAALRAVRKGGRVVCAGIHMSDIPSFPYRLLWEERQIVSVANLTREDAREFLAVVARAGIVTTTTAYPLIQANEALADLRAGRLEGAAVLVPTAA